MKCILKEQTLKFNYNYHFDRSIMVEILNLPHLNSHAIALFIEKGSFVQVGEQKDAQYCAMID